MATKLRVLVVEDEPLIAMELETLVRELGCECIGPVMNFSQGLAMAESADIDCAILNLVLQDKLAYPIAEVLEGRGVPFGFATGVVQTALPPRWSGRPFVD